LPLQAVEAVEGVERLGLVVLHLEDPLPGGDRAREVPPLLLLDPADPYRMQNAYFQYENEKKNEGIALLLEFFIPGVGSIYAEHLNGALLTWACTIGGFVLVFWGFSQAFEASVEERNEDETAGAAILGGLALVVGGRIYGLYDSYASSKDFNLRLRHRLGLDVGLSVAPLRAPGGDVVWAPSLRLEF